MGQQSTTGRRHEVIEQLLSRYAELTDPQQSRSGLGDGDHVPLMPATYTASVRELERLLLVMRQDRTRPLVTLKDGRKASVRSLWWHVSERYLRSTVVLKDTPVKRKAKHGKTLTVLERRAVVQYDPKVSSVHVDRAIEWLASEWTLTCSGGLCASCADKGDRCRGIEPSLPKELMAA